jgi:glycosyltransferase involved in cell wall biosynthesis
MLSIVIPAYNEERGIREIVDRVLAIRPQLPAVGIDRMELIVVDDGSRDRTAEVVADCQNADSTVRLVRHARNGGYGAALKTGFASAEGEWISFLDADGTYPPEYFPQLYKVAVESKADLVIGSRMAGAASEMPLVRRLGNLIFANLVSVISAERITDSASGMRLFRKSDLSRFYPLPDGLNLTPVMSTRALHEKMRMIEFPIPYSERVGRSKLSVVRDGMRFAQSIVGTALHYNPVRPLGIVGIAAIVAAVMVGIWLVWQRLSGVNTLGPAGAFSLFTAMVMAVAGLSVLLLGLSFNYFVGLFHKTPIRQGLFGKPLFPGLEKSFGLAGALCFGGGVVMGGVMLGLGLQGWPMTRLWLYYLASASLCLIGVQLAVAYIQIQVLQALSLREKLIASDLRGKDKAEIARPALNDVQIQPASSAYHYSRLGLTEKLP